MKISLFWPITERYKKPCKVLFKTLNFSFHRLIILMLAQILDRELIQVWYYYFYFIIVIIVMKVQWIHTYKTDDIELTQTQGLEINTIFYQIFSLHFLYLHFFNYFLHYLEGDKRGVKFYVWVIYMKNKVRHNLEFFGQNVKDKSNSK